MSYVHTSEVSNTLSCPIDLVYLWCDGNDPQFVDQKKVRMNDVGLREDPQNTGDVRYVQFDELKYSLRSVLKNIPWIRNIFIVTNNQRPSWLKNHSKITIIDHTEIVPSNFLPTFSSCCIELFITQIPGLSEKFLYANDDMFFYRTLKPSDFFDADGKPLVWISKDESDLTILEAKEILEDEGRKDWMKTVVRAWVKFQCTHKKKIPFYTPAHSVDAYTRTYFTKVIETYPELLHLNTQPFRTGNELSRVIFSYELINSFDCKCIGRQKPNFWTLFHNLIFNDEMVSIIRPNLKKTRKSLTLFNPKTFCLNDLSHELPEDLDIFFNELFPEAAPWENDSKHV